MQTEAIKDKIIDLVIEGSEFDDIKRYLKTQNLSEDHFKALLSFTDEMIYHRALQEGKRSNALTQFFMGLALLLVPLLVAYIAYDPTSKIRVIWYGAALIGAWNVKEGWKKYRAPFEPPNNFGYNRKKFQRF